MLTLLIACSDYAIEDKNDPAPFDTGTALTSPPDIVVSPDAVEVYDCVEGGSTLHVENVGGSVLTIGDVVVTGDWAVAAVSLPLELPPGASVDLVLSGTGAGSVSIRSDDPDEPNVEVPLSVIANTPPEITWLAPDHGTTLAVSSVTDFSALVYDAEQGPDTLTVSWTSDVDGLLSTTPAASDGTTGFLWDSATRTPGTHSVDLTVTDACGATASASITVCQDQGYEADNLDLDTWHFEGSALWDGSNSWVQITDAFTDQSGTAFQTASTVDSANVVINFLFFVSGGSGADGISLTALDSTRMTGFVGSSGGGIGYLGLPGWSIEVDTWYNAEYSDPTEEDHVSFHVDGDVSNPLAWAPLPEMEDGAWHEMVVSVVGTRVDVEIDGATYLDLNIPEVDSFPAYVGFTGGTGSYTNRHLIDSLLVTRSVCEE